MLKTDYSCGRVEVDGTLAALNNITKGKHTSRGKYKAQVLSRYHRPTQNRKQYTSNNIIKSTTILNRWQQQVQEPLTTTPSTSMRTQASTPYSFGK